MNILIMKLESTCNLTVHNLPESPAPNTNTDLSIFPELCNFLGIEAQESRHNERAQDPQAPRSQHREGKVESGG